MSFALAHAVHHDLDRVIVVIPFTSIIEQTSDALREAIGEGNVLEHHSALDPRKETPRNRVASENWDAPVVVTTTVQFFESLFANRPRACRKLHRIARSVIILDEAQSLPVGLLTPILDALKLLIERYRATLVISTATQPAFQRSRDFPEGIGTIREIVPHDLHLHEPLRRVRVRWPKPETVTFYETIAGELAALSNALAIVHRRADARMLTELVDSITPDTSTYHLSALMCAEHRSRVLAEIKRRKRGSMPVRLVATQLVEAGTERRRPLHQRCFRPRDRRPVVPHQAQTERLENRPATRSSDHQARTADPTPTNTLMNVSA